MILGFIFSLISLPVMILVAIGIKVTSPARFCLSRPAMA
jgi:lipopolysaccharide/colanic/teichoic acid biosynthesis glycosyltransferase